MIHGTVNDDGTPVIRFAVAQQFLTAIIDTGFNGDLELPDELREHVNARFLCRVRSLLAAGQSVDEDNYLVEIQFDGKIVTAEATFSPGREILVGTHLLRRYRLEINFDQRSVVLERAT